MKSNKILVFIILAAITIASNLTKAVNIDDTAYLGMARAIISDPWHPLSQELNWNDTAEPIFVINQPILVPGLLAVGIKLFGESQIVLHLIISMTSLAAIAFFYLIAKTLNIQHALFLTCLFSLGPAFLPGQNLMVDMPLMALWLIFFWAILTARGKHTHRQYLIASLAVSAACLTKYTSLILLPILLWVLVSRRHWAQLLYLLIPTSFIVGWSIYNILDFGAVHILGRNVKSVFQNNFFIEIVGWFVGLGSISPFLIGFLPRPKTKIPPIVRLFAWVFGIIFLGMLILLSVWNQYAIYWALFLLTGLLTFIFAVRTAVFKIIAGFSSNDSLTVENNLVLILWLVGDFAFIILFSQFLAIRHIFLALPPILLMLGEQIPPQNPDALSTRKIASVILTASLGIALAISDYYYADLYRIEAVKIRAMLGENTQVWVVGHWGWEWYAKMAGMQPYDNQNSDLQNGDYVVLAEYVHQQQISPGDKLRLKPIRRIEIPAPITTWLRTTYTDQLGGYYAYVYPYLLPWRFSNAPYVFSIFEVTPP